MVQINDDPGEGLNAALIAQVGAEAGARRWSIPTLADRSGISYNSLKRYMSGDRHLTVAHVSKLAAAFDMTPGQLVRAAEARLAGDAPPEVVAHLTAEEWAEVQAARANGRDRIGRLGHSGKESAM